MGYSGLFGHFGLIEQAPGGNRLRGGSVDSVVMKSKRIAIALVFLALLHANPATGALNQEAQDGRIAYVKNSSGLTDIASLRPSGRGRISLTSSKANELYVDVSPDGTLVAFTRFRPGGGEIYTVPIAGGPATRLTFDEVHDELPIWSPDSNRIAFVSYPEADDPEIFVMNADGTEPTRVTDNSDPDVDPRWSPDGTQLIFNRGNIDEASQDIYLVTLGQPGETRLTEEGVNDSFGEWAPDGTSIVYSSYRNEQWDVYSTEIGSLEQTRLTTDPNDDYAPRWSPDGGTLAYVNGRLEGNLPKDRVTVLSSQGTPEFLSPARLDAFSASWAPSGQRIVFIGHSGPAANWEIFTVGADGSGLERLTRTAAMEFDPAWARR
jgi:Tol biopolymer transport system component